MSGYEFDKKVGRRLAKLRPAEKSQQDVATDLGVKRESINHWENGIKHIKAEDIVRLAAYYNASADYILGLSNVTTPDITTQAAALRYGLSEETLNTIQSLTDNEKWELELLLNSRHLPELLHCIGSCYTSRHNIQGEEAIIRAHQSHYHTLNIMSAHEKDPEKKRALDSLQAEVKRLQKKSMEQAENAEANSVIRLQRTAVSIGEEICDKSRKEAPDNGNSDQA